MSRRAMGALAIWLCVLAAAAVIALRARYITDLSAFLPSHPSAAEKLLVDQLRDGPGSRLILIGLAGGEATTRAALSASMAARLRSDPEFATSSNGAQASAERDREFLFTHRYLLSAAVTPRRFSPAGLRAALRETLENLASPEGLLLEPLVPHDPTGETLEIVDALARIPAPRSRDGVWVSADGARALLVAQTAAPGSDTDAQEHALRSIRAAFDAARDAAGPAARGVELLASGPAVFAVAARAGIVRAAVRLSIASSVLIAVILLGVYRSAAALVLGLLPVATGALVGVAAVALGFGAVHGITLGFGITLIGESVDYSIYFFIQSQRGADWRRSVWPTMRLGMLTSVCGFASLLPSGFPGLAQLGAYSIGGLLAAAAVTRFVLPAIVPRRFAIRDLEPLGSALARRLSALAPRPALRRLAALILAALALAVIANARGSLWNRELSSLSPVPPGLEREDAGLRADLGAPDALDLIVVSGESLDAALRGAERAGDALTPLIAAKVIGGFDSPASYLPSLETQMARRAALPPPAELAAALHGALSGLDLDESQLAPFLGDVEAARHAALLGPRDLEGTSLAAGFSAMIMRRGEEWDALLPLRAPPGGDRIESAPVEAALQGAGLDGQARLLDPKTASDALYDEYLREAIRFSLAGFAAIVLLLVAALRSASRAARVIAPLALAVLVVAAVLALCRVELTILHLVGMLLIVAVGSNYALFFDHVEAGAAGRTLASLVVANLCTMLGFGLLSFSGVPVLEALGTTVAPGTFLALLFAAALTPPSARISSTAAPAGTGP
jgi:predicted exporter